MSKGRQRVLFVFPVPLNAGGHGNVRRMLELARYLHSREFLVDLVYLSDSDSGEDPFESQCRAFGRIFRAVKGATSSYANQFEELFSRFHANHPPSGYFRPDPAFAVLVRALLESGDYGSVISCYAWSAPMFAGLSRSIVKVLDAQDIMHKHAESCRAATASTTIFDMNPDTEAFLWRQWDAVLAITEEDRDFISLHTTPVQVVQVVPHGAPAFSEQAEVGCDDLILYTGSDNDCNMRSMQWFFDQVWPRIQESRPDSKLRLVGLIANHFAKFGCPSGVKAIGLQDDLGQELKQAGVVIAPYLYGSGLKIKMVEAAAAGKAIVTTPAGIAGSKFSPATDVIAESDAAEFARGVCKLLASSSDRRRLGMSALEVARQDYSPDHCYGGVADLLDRLGAARAERSRSGRIPEHVIQKTDFMFRAASAKRLVIYGNGSHTRELIIGLTDRNIRPEIILDRSCKISYPDEESILIMNPMEYEPIPADLIVLSSQTFEHEMWRDIAGLRAIGVWAMALYDEALITGSLRKMVFPMSEERSLPQTARMSRRFQRAADAESCERKTVLICDPNIKSIQGHYLGYASSVAKAAGDDGWRAAIAANARMTSMCTVNTSSRELFIPAFEYDYWQEMVPATSAAAHNHFAQYGRFFSEALGRVIRDKQLKSSDLVFLPCANLVEALGVVYLHRMVDEPLPKFNLLFRFGISEMAYWGRLDVTSMTSLLRYSIHALLDVAMKGQVRLTTDSELLSEEYSQLVGCTFDTVPIPVVSPKVDLDRSKVGLPWTLMYLGDARPEKGFQFLPSVADELKSELEMGHVRMILQANLNSASDDSVLRALRYLESLPNVELHRNALSKDKYESLIQQADVMLLPYQADRYVARTSGVLAEAICAGIPAVVPEGTWLSLILKQGFGAGVPFSGEPNEGLRRAIRDAYCRRSSLKKDALKNQHRFSQLHNPASLWTHLQGV